MSFGTTFFHIQSILAFRKQRKNISKYNSTWLFILARHEDKRIDILVVVQDLELEMKHANLTPLNRLHGCLGQIMHYMNSMLACLHIMEVHINSKQMVMW